MDGNECCTSSPIARQKLTLSLFLAYFMIYMQMEVLKHLWEFRVKAYTILATDSVREGKYCQDNRSIRVQHQENAEVWLPEWIGTSWRFACEHLPCAFEIIVKPLHNFSMPAPSSLQTYCQQILNLSGYQWAHWIPNTMPGHPTLGLSALRMHGEQMLIHTCPYCLYRW